MLSERLRRPEPAAVYSVAITVVLPLLAAIVLRAPGRAGVVIAAALLINALYRVANPGRTSGANRATGRAQTVLTLLLAAWLIYVVIAMLIIPFSVYMTWFRLVELGQQRGPVSHLFLSVIGFFVAVIGGRVYRNGVVAPSITLAVVLLVAAGMALHSALPLMLAAPLVVPAIAMNRNACVHGAEPAGSRAMPAVLRAAFALLLAALVLAFLSGGSRSATGNRYIDQKLSPMLRRTVVRLFPGYPLLYGGDGYGYSFDQQSLGGTPLLSSVPILEVSGQPGERIYLRTDVYDHYSGNSWLRTEELLEQLQEPNPDMIGGYDGNAHSFPLPVTILTEFYEKLPHTLTTRTVSSNGQIEMPAIRGHIDVGYQFDLPLGSGDSFVLQRVLDEPVIQDRGLRRNLQLPQGIPSEVRRIAQSLGRGHDDRRDVLAAITDYLADGFSYSLEINPTLEEVDFVEEFLLDSRTGYCVHFATSFVVLARMNEIPARYVTGFLVSVPYMDDYADLVYETGHIEDGLVRHRVTGYAAHAWPEVWLPDSGWVVWEATPAMRPGEYDDTAFLRTLQQADSLTSRQLREILGRREELAANPDSEAQRSQDNWYRLLIIPGLALAGAAVFGYRRRCVPLLDSRRAVDALAQRLACTARRRRVVPPDQIGWRQWSRDAATVAPEQREALHSAGELIQRTCFGGYRPSRADVTQLQRVEYRFRRSSKPRA